MSSSPDLVVFYWVGSPWASKVTTYLALRGIPHYECHVPITMPRPTLEALGVNYRRIPVVAIGRDIYCDTLLILQKLEKLTAEGRLSAKKPSLAGKTPEQKALELLLEKWTDVVVFPRAAAGCIPTDHPLVTDEKFIKDRSELWGEDWSVSAREKRRPESLVNMLGCFDLLEETILSDGRKWIYGEEGPTLADIHAAWIFDWMLQLPGSFPEDLISAKSHPKTFAWSDRYNKAVAAAQEANGKPTVLEHDDAIKQVQNSSFVDKDTGVAKSDPLGLKEGQDVVMSPVDTGFTAKDQGKLLSLSGDHAVVGKKTKEGVDVKIHNPRWNFQVKAA